MQINKETAFKIWNHQFGSATKIKDFAGREIAKAAYDDRNSKFGWNIDHILPQSHGGKSNESNLICCHILTNDEKADSYPCFWANNKKFEIKRRQNHYEIFTVNNNSNITYNVDFFSAKEGLDFFDACLDENPLYVLCNIVIYFKNKNFKYNNAFMTFIKEIFGDDLEYSCYENDKKNSYYLDIYILKRDCLYNEDVQDLLDKCILLNTYSDKYFNKFFSDDITIFLGSYIAEAYYVDITLNDLIDELEINDEIANGFSDESNFLINKLTKINSNLSKKDLEIIKNNLFAVDLVFDKLTKELNKIIK